MWRMPRLRIGLQLNTTQRAFRWSEIRELAQVAESSGLDALWTEDHLFYDAPDGTVGPWEAWTILAGLADATSRVRIGSLVTPLGLRSPTVLAKQAVTVDEISGGRLVLGIGLGWNEAEFRGAGVPTTERIGRFEEAFAVLRSALDDGAASATGRHLSVTGFQMTPRPVVRRRPELLVGSIGPRVLRATLPYVEGWNWDGFRNDPARFSERSAQVTAACHEVGRDPAMVERSAHLVVRLEDAVGLPIDPLPPDFPIITGSPREVADSLSAFAHAGASEVQLIVDPLTPRSIETLARTADYLDHG